MSNKKRQIKIHNPAPAADAADADLSFPKLATDLVKELDAIYPSTCIRLGQSVEDAHRYAGKRELIDELIEWMHDNTKPGT
jgi:hypothetical protein